MKTPLVLMLSRTDYANVGAFFVRSLQSVGVDAYIFQERNRYYMMPGYCAPTVQKIQKKELSKLVEISNIIVWIQTLKQREIRKCPTFNIFKNVMNNSSKKTAVFHGGTVYRRDPLVSNRIFGKVDISLVQTAEMLDKGAKNEVWMLPTAFIHPDVEPKISMGKKIVIGHFPSAKNLSIKGSHLINDVVNRYGDQIEYRFSRDRVSWIESLKRMNECDIYIESLSCASNTNNKHDWSVTALEAAMLGKIVITNFSFGYERYKKEYGECGLLVANTPEELKSTLNNLLSKNKESLENMKKKTREWAENTHGLIPTGKRLRRSLNV